MAHAPASAPAKSCGSGHSGSDSGYPALLKTAFFNILKIEKGTRRSGPQTPCF